MDSYDGFLRRSESSGRHCALYWSRWPAKRPVRTLITRLLLAFLLASAAFAQTAPPRGAKTHVLLLDVSRSMQQRYANNLKGWLVEPILRSSAFAKGDHIILRSFDRRGNTSFNPIDPQRLYDGGYDASGILTRVPNHASGSNTDLPEAMNLALADLQGLGVTGDVLIWLITDNVQAVSGNTNIDPLYRSISGEKNFQAAYLFPLIKENNVTVTPTNNAMVLYLLHYSTQGSRLKLNGLADEIGSKLHNDPVTWFPIERAIELDAGNIQANGETAPLVDGKLILPNVPEGVPPNFEITFRFKSQLRGREIKQGKLSGVKGTIATPESVEAEGNLADALTGFVSPPVLKLKPNQRSSATYQAHVEAGGLTFHPTGFWQAVWNSESDPIDGQLLLPLDGVDTEMDSKTVSTVKNLDEIKKIIRQGASAKSAIPLDISFRVSFKSGWRRLTAVFLALAVLGGLAGAGSLFFLKSQYELSTPQGERVLAFPLFGHSYISISNETAAVITRRLGRLTVAPLGLYTFDGERTQPRALTDIDNHFILENKEARRRYEYSIRRLVAKRPAIAPADDFLE